MTNQSGHDSSRRAKRREVSKVRQLAQASEEHIEKKDARKHPGGG